MSTKTLLSSQPSQISVYQHLLRLSTDSDLFLKKESLEALPQSLRQKIFGEMREQLEKTGTLNSKDIDIFDDLPKLQLAVQKVATDALQLLDPKDKSTDSLPVLLETMHNRFGDLTPEIQRILDDWEKQGEPEEQRTEARIRIITFLSYDQSIPRDLYCLDLNCLNLKSLPMIFDQKLSRLQNLKELALRCNQLETIPEHICQLNNLRRLDLYNNQLKTLPEQIKQLKKLRNLDLFANQLEALPEQFNQLESLRNLNLGNNKFFSFPKEIEQLSNLEDLSLVNNNLKSVPGEIGRLKNLKHLDLRLNFLSSLPLQIGQLEKLESLFLDNNHIESLPEQIEGLKELRSLLPKKIDLSPFPTKLDAS